mgnify:CR=1 FL=1
MKIAVIENYNCKCEYIGRPRRNADELYSIEYSHVYTFYSDSKDISVDSCKIIDKFLKTYNKFKQEVLDYSISEEATQIYDIEKTNLLAKKLNCQIFEPGKSPLNIFQHIMSIRGDFTAEVIDYATLPIIKYMKLIKRQSYMDGRINDQYWRGEDLWSEIRIDDDNNLCCVNGHDVFRISTLKADRIYIPYNSHDKDIFQGFQCLAIIVKDNQWGVINTIGEVIVDYQKFRIVEVYNTFCVVESNAAFSCIDFDGRVLMPFTSQEFGIYFHRYVEVVYDHFKLLYDLKSSKLILNAIYKDFRYICDNYTIVNTTDGLFDIYDTNSLKLNDKSFETVDFSNSQMIVCKSSQGWFVYDLNGSIVFSDIENKYISVQIFDDGHICLKQKKENGYNIYGLADSTGRIIFPCYSDSPIKVFQHEGDFYYILKKYKKEYLCNSNGHILSAKYDLIKTGNEGICIVYDGQYAVEYDKINYYDGVFYAITLDGKVKFSIKCQNLFAYKNGLATIKQNDKYGKVNLEGEIVIPPKYDYIGTFSYGLIAVCANNLWGYIDIHNNTVVDIKYDRADDFDEDGKAYVELDGYCSHINTKGEHIDDEERIIGYNNYYDSIDEDTYIRDGIAEAFNDDPANYWNID